MAGIGAEEAEAHLVGGLEAADVPARALLEVRGEGGWHEAVLEGFVDEDGAPARAEQEGRGEDVFGEGVGREAADGFEGGAPHDVAASGAPGYAEGLLEGFHEVEEGDEGLLKGVVRRDVVV